MENLYHSHHQQTEPPIFISWKSDGVRNTFAYFSERSAEKKIFLFSIEGREEQTLQHRMVG